MISDPSGKNTERSLNESEVVKGYSENKIKQQITRILEFGKGENPVVARTTMIGWLV